MDPDDDVDDDTGGPLEEADDGMAPIVTNTGSDDDAADEADAASG